MCLASALSLSAISRILCKYSLCHIKLSNCVSQPLQNTPDLQRGWNMAKFIYDNQQTECVLVLGYSSPAMRNVLYFWCTDCLLVMQASVLLLLIITLQLKTLPVMFVLQKWMIPQTSKNISNSDRCCADVSRVQGAPSTVYWPSILQVSNWTAALKGPPNKTPLTLCSFFNHPRNWLHCSECPPHKTKRQAASWDGMLCLWDGLPSWTMENWSVSAEDACWFPEWDAWIAKR